MMSILMYFIFLIPICFSSNFLVLMIFMILGFFIFLNSNFFLNFFGSVSYFFSGDLLSMSLIFLTIWICMLMILSSLNLMNSSMNSYFLLVVMFLLIFLLLTFMTYNLFMFFIFFESSLIPTLLLIFGWGYQPERLTAGYYLLFYTLFGSFPLLISIFYIYGVCGTLFFDLILLNTNIYLYLGLVLGFLIKMPMFMFHFWLPKAHVEAPISGSMILAGVLLKLGGYGLMRVMSFFNLFFLSYNLFFMSLSLMGMIYIGMICMFQVDMKSMIAYSSVGHMGLVICGIFTMNYWGLLGSLVLMIGHGLCSSGLFCLANIVYERVNSRSFYINKGLITLMPSLSLFWFLFCSNNMASPPSLNLLGEVMLINSLMGWCSFTLIFLFLSSFLSCCYSIYLYANTQHGLLYSGLKMFKEVTIREFMLLSFHWIPLNFIIMKTDIFVIWL